MRTCCVLRTVLHCAVAQRVRGSKHGPLPTVPLPTLPLPTVPLTSFAAPTNDAFAALAPWEVKYLTAPENLLILKNVLLYHDSGAAVPSYTPNQKIPSLQGSNFFVEFIQGVWRAFCHCFGVFSARLGPLSFLLLSVRHAYAGSGRSHMRQEHRISG